MERRKGNFSAALIVIQLVLTLLTVFFVKYDEEADATNPKHSYKRPFGGADPQDNPIEKFYPSRSFFLSYFTSLTLASVYRFCS